MKYVNFEIIILLLFLNLIKLVSADENESNSPLKVALCAIAKNENLYIREWVEYYKNIGISKVIINDNNDKEGERFDVVINDYIEDGFVDINDMRGIVKNDPRYGYSIQGQAYEHCYDNYHKNYDWMLFFDADEFLFVESKYKDIYEFLNDFSDYDGIKVQWKVFGDNGHLYYENKPVIERFLNETNMHYTFYVKTILKCKDHKYRLLFGPHGVSNKETNIVNMKKKKVDIKKPIRNDFRVYYDLPVYLYHFLTKSTQEYIERKFNKTDAHYGGNFNNIRHMKKKYFQYNEHTKEKDEMFQSAVTISNDMKEIKEKFNNNYNNIYYNKTNYNNEFSLPYPKLIRKGEIIIISIIIIIILSLAFIIRKSKTKMNKKIAYFRLEQDIKL